MKRRNNRMGGLKRTLQITAAITMALTTTAVDAAIRPPNAFRHNEIIDAQTKELNLSLLEKIERLNMAYRFDMNDYIPYGSLENDDSAGKVASRILRHSLQNWLDSDSAKNSPLAKSATSINDNLSPSLKSSNFTFRIKPLDTRAELIYRGAVEATLSYTADEEEISLGF